MPKPLNLQYLLAFQERLCRDGYSDIAARLPAIYAKLGKKAGRREVDRLRRKADRARVSSGLVPANSPRRVSSAKYIRLWLRRHPASAPILDPKKFQEVPASQMPGPLSHLQAWEFDLPRRMAFTPDYLFFLYLEPMWYRSQLRRAGHPLLDAHNRVHTFVHRPRALKLYARLARESFGPPPLALISFAEARLRYDPDTRLISTDGLQPEQE